MKDLDEILIKKEIDEIMKNVDNIMKKVETVMPGKEENAQPQND